MRIFLDANVLVSVLNKEYPLFTYSSRILSLTDHKGYEVFTSPLCLAIAFYFAEKKNKKSTRQKIGLLCENLSITTVNESAVKQTTANSAIHDFEDGLEYFSAIDSKCDCIITEDVDDFYFSKIDVLTCETFFDKHLVSKK
ncbi:PIN domain-containing protein [Terrimonas pollutisoli]|uniref:PIN domain-containing protein n=1 Tax=Terrimonas pollutisoli TaxID=3034147 RepID=UPI0023ED7375|nr:PIN domain-containing protein [Terrimonas sp. H1YJ31]